MISFVGSKKLPVCRTLARRWLKCWNIFIFAKTIIINWSYCVIIRYDSYHKLSYHMTLFQVKNMRKNKIAKIYKQIFLKKIQCKNGKMNNNCQNKNFKKIRGLSGEQFGVVKSRQATCRKWVKWSKIPSWSLSGIHFLVTEKTAKIHWRNVNFSKKKLLCRIRGIRQRLCF